jgi:transcriptional regulator with XRE-family HTH domain
MLKLKLERLLRGMTLAELGEKTGVPYSDICRYETGRMKPYPSHLKRLSEYFGVPADELMKEVTNLGEEVK